MLAASAAIFEVTMDFQTFLDIKPDPSELTKHVNTSKWYCLGSKLNCDRTKLDEIGELSESDACKTKLLFEHLCASTATSRRQVLEVLRMNLIQEDEVANEYEEFLKGHHAATCKSEMSVQSLLCMLIIDV